MVEKKAPRDYWSLRWIKQKEIEENFIMRSFKICNERGDGRGM
jgi:hypothetical protein